MPPTSSSIPSSSPSASSAWRSEFRARDLVYHNQVIARPGMPLPQGALEDRVIFGCGTGGAMKRTEGKLVRVSLSLEPRGRTAPVTPMGSPLLLSDDADW